MRRAFLIAVLMLAGSVSVLAQTLDTIYWNQRRADLYYWGSYWIDSNVMAHPGSQYLYTKDGDITGNMGDRYWGRTCVTTSPMKVIGIAAPVRIGCPWDYYSTDGGDYWVLDTTTRFP